jgi:hypothetical protein
MNIHIKNLLKVSLFKICLLNIIKILIFNRFQIIIINNSYKKNNNQNKKVRNELNFLYLLVKIAIYN